MYHAQRRVLSVWLQRRSYNNLYCKSVDWRYRYVAGRQAGTNVPTHHLRPETIAYKNLQIHTKCRDKLRVHLLGTVRMRMVEPIQSDPNRTKPNRSTFFVRLALARRWLVGCHVAVAGRIYTYYTYTYTRTHTHAVYGIRWYWTSETDHRKRQ